MTTFAGWHNTTTLPQNIAQQKYTEYKNEIRQRLMQLREAGQIQTFDPKTISESDRNKYMASFLPIAKDCFSRSMAYDEVYSHAFNTEKITIATDEQHKPIGFSTIDFLFVDGRKVLYLNGSFISPQHQRKHLYASLKLNDFENSGSAYDVFATRTQNPRIYGALAKFAPLAPSPQSHTVQDSNLYSAVAQKLGMGKLNIGDVAKGFYGRCLYDQTPSTTDTCIQHFFDTSLNLNQYKGDALLILGKYAHPNNGK